MQHTTDEFPVVLSAGSAQLRQHHRRTGVAEAPKRVRFGSVGDAARYGIGDGDRVRMRLLVGPVIAEISETMMDGHMSLPNRMGLAYSPASGEPEIVGVAPGELTTLDWRDRSPARPGTSTFRPELGA